MCKEKNVIPYFYTLAASISTGAGGKTSFINFSGTNNPIIVLPVEKPVYIKSATVRPYITGLQAGEGDICAGGSFPYSLRLSVRQNENTPLPPTGGRVTNPSSIFSIANQNVPTVVINNFDTRQDVNFHGTAILVSNIGFDLGVLPAGRTVNVIFAISIFTLQ